MSQVAHVLAENVGGDGGWKAVDGWGWAFLGVIVLVVVSGIASLFKRK